AGYRENVPEDEAGQGDPARPRKDRGETWPRSRSPTGQTHKPDQEKRHGILDAACEPEIVLEGHEQKTTGSPDGQDEGEDRPRPCPTAEAAEQAAAAQGDERDTANPGSRGEESGCHRVEDAGVIVRRPAENDSQSRPSRGLEVTGRCRYGGSRARSRL